RQASSNCRTISSDRCSGELNESLCDRSLDAIGTPADTDSALPLGEVRSLHEPYPHIAAHYRAAHSALQATAVGTCRRLSMAGKCCEIDSSDEPVRRPGRGALPWKPWLSWRGAVLGSGASGPGGCPAQNHEMVGNVAKREFRRAQAAGREALAETGYFAK